MISQSFTEFKIPNETMTNSL